MSLFVAFALGALAAAGAIGYRVYQLDGVAALIEIVGLGRLLDRSH